MGKPAKRGRGQRAAMTVGGDPSPHPSPIRDRGSPRPSEWPPRIGHGRGDGTGGFEGRDMSRARSSS